ncbi:MAG: hypothetical protein GTO55_00360 [Armatimonadetes bacterium]|nr:hypothetical protein [Armatimonadota bacterium]NIM23892.1 hypothetical protein [Armatimonadota bacterium]NIM66611.1 hypothetical protein [Armatimonadota bacterium]NIM76279.1 hypothetical protein [Armatimonadota bacterium]NIN05973.1 hypothetical protein [Armatimonadota bacterium]
MIEASQSWAARQIKESVEYLRQRKYDPTASMFLYFWSDPWPCLFGSGLLDYYRRKYKAYDIFEMVYSPVLVSIEWLKDKHYVGFEKTYTPGEDLKAKIWVTNDMYQQFEDASLSWCIKGPDGEVLAEGGSKLCIAVDSSEVVKNVSWPIPKDARGNFRMEAQVKDKAGKLLSANYFEFFVSASC